MKPTMFISSVLSKISLPKRRLEAAANCTRDSRNNTLIKNIKLDGYENVEWKFLTVSGSGSVELVFSNKHKSKMVCVEIPALANFLAVCIRGDSENYKLEFGISLS